jgi:xanthine dehydrogenase YagR molybdenum-binding subunit
MTICEPSTRIEGPLKVTGAALYAADNYPQGALHAVMVGSPLAAGRVTAIDAAAALAVPGVARVFTHADMPALGKPGFALAISHLPLTTEEIQWEGQTVALVLAESLEAAEEAAALVRVSIAAESPATPGHGQLERPQSAMGAPAETKGDPEAGFAAAKVRVKQSYFQPTRNHNPMETSATIAAWEGDSLTVWDATQATQNPVEVLSGLFELPREKVRVIAPHTGGGFGCKGFVWPHVVLAVAAARIVGRPVRLALTRAQQYAMTGHQPEVRQTMTLGAAADGTLTAIRHQAVNTTSIADTQFEAPASASRSFYACDAIDLDQHVERINLVKSTPMRSPVEGPGSWALESAMDELARELGIDPLDLRLRNYAEVDPFDGRPWSSKKLRECYLDGAEAYGWRTRHERPRQDGVWTIGHGMATAGSFVARFPAKAEVRLAPNGEVSVACSANDIGTGNQTIFGMIAGEVLGIEPRAVNILWGDSRLPPAGPVYGSSHTMGTGGAVRLAAEDLRRKLVALGAPAEGPIDVALLAGRIGAEPLVGQGDFGAQVLGGQTSRNGSGTPYAMGTWGANFVEVGVDRDLGLIRLRRVVARYSAGRILNPLTARSQMIGSITWEWGKATMEASTVEPTYARFLAKNLSNVAIPVSADIPSAIDVDFIDEVDYHASPTGARGIGELGGTGVAAAVANAIYDAVGVRLRNVPMLPGDVLEGLERLEGRERREGLALTPDTAS